MTTRLVSLCLSIFTVGALLAPTLAFAQNERVMVVPFAQRDPSVPHPAHENAQITLKATIRNATCASGYRVWWDVDRDGNYDDEYSKDYSRNATIQAVWDIGRTFKVPTVPRDTTMNINVKVLNKCSNQNIFATYRLFIYDFNPSSDPRNWTADQIEIMTSMGNKEAMWYMHRRMTGMVGANTNTWYGSTPTGSYGYGGIGLHLWLMAVNGHLPAYPPNSINTYNRALPEGWEEANTRRYNADPLAETASRLANYLTKGGATVGLNSGAAQELSTCGYNADGSERQCQRIAGTSDGAGAYTTHGQNVYLHGQVTGALSTVLPALAGTPLQKGTASIIGKNWEWYLQQMVDRLGDQQVDGGATNGGWSYQVRHGNYGATGAMGSTSQWAYIGMESAEVAGGPYGVFVNNRHKYKIANHFVYNQRATGGATYRKDQNGRGSVKLTGGSFVAGRWLGVHLFNRNDNTVPWNNWNGYTKGRLREAYDNYLSFTATNWVARQRADGVNWNDGFWQYGDYLCGDTNNVYNNNTSSTYTQNVTTGLRCGNTYAIYSHQKGYRTGAPELTEVGGHNWVREFSTYFLRAQDRALRTNDPWWAYNSFGRSYDNYCFRTSMTCRYGLPYMTSAMGGLVLTPTVFKPKPIALASVAPAEVSEGCSGGNAGRVVFTHSDSFHPNSDARITAFQWDVNAANGLWWDTDADPDFETPGVDGRIADTFTYAYQRQGNYVATLRVVDNDGQTKQTTVRVQVNASNNVPPSVSAGGPYAIEVGENLQLQGTSADQNSGCGDQITVAWDVDGDGFDDGNGDSPAVAWAALSALPVGRAVPIRVRATDKDGATADSQTTLTIYPTNPVAAGRANPNPATCAREVTFDGNASAHANPARSIAQYEWDIDGNGTFDGAGAIYRYTYQQFGTYTVTLKVTDDRGRSDTVEINVPVTGGNVPPVARIENSAAGIIVLEGDGLTLDGRASSEPNAACGDSIVEYAWDLDGDGNFGGAGDVSGARVLVPWNTLDQRLAGPADPDTGLPKNTVTLRVTDTVGNQHTAQVTVTLLDARPRPRVVQSPLPSPISLRNGSSNTTLDARESTSPIAGVNIVNYAWDLDGNGTFEFNGAVAPLVKIFNPVPAPDAIPAVVVTLRITDDAGRTADLQYTVVYKLPPTPPTADADPTNPPERGYHILVGDNLLLDGTASFDPDTAEFDDFLTAYRWDLNYDGDVFGSDIQGDQNGARLTVFPNLLDQLGLQVPGEYTIRLQVEDTTNLTSEDNAKLFVYARAPTATITSSVIAAACGERINLDGRASVHNHPDINVVGYAWDLDGDGQFDDGDQPTANVSFDQFTFGQPNVVSLQVTDSEGEVGVATFEIPVNQGNRAPVANPGGFRNAAGAVVGPYVIIPGDTLALSALGSSDPDASCGDRIVTYRWDLDNDGQWDIEINRASPRPLSWADLSEFGIDRPGNLDIRLQVVDRFGATADSIATLRVVNGPKAIATANPNRAACAEQVTFDAAASTTEGPAAQDFDIVAYAWDLDGDGQFDDADTVRVTKAVVALPDANGAIGVSATMRITDGRGNIDTATVSVVIDVQNLPPVANAGGPYTTGPINNVFSEVTLDGRSSSDPNEPCDALTVYKWDVDNDGLYGADDPDGDPVGALVSFRNAGWQVNTSQTVRLIVCDLQDVCSPPSEAEITVLGEAPPTAELISPRAADGLCIGGGQFEVRVSVADPEGDRVTLFIDIGGQRVAERSFATNANGNPVDVRVPVNANAVPEGSHQIVVRVVDSGDAEVTVNSGGRIDFDSTDPEIVIGNQLGANVCYAPGQVPDPNITVTDNIDDAPQMQSRTAADGCAQTLTVTATDSCGNIGTATRTYLLAQPASATINGATENQLVAEARMSWVLEGAAACSSGITATLARNGAAAQPYAESTLVNQAGAYRLDVNVEDCSGRASRHTRNFIVNTPPVASVIPAGHPNTDPDRADSYVVDEGQPLEVDASQSTAPEEADRIARYQWDFDGDGTFDAEGPQAAFPTDNDGVFNGVLRVTDSIGGTTDKAFRVTIRDATPVIDTGGPYVVQQGVETQFDASGSQGIPEDPIQSITWSWGDGTADTDGARAAHTFTDDGIYVVTVIVIDEDGRTEQTIRIEVRDVDPEIEGVTQPAQTFEIRPMTFTANVSPGAPADPIGRYEWDFDGDGNPEFSGPQRRTVSFQFVEEGQHTVTLSVRDNDSVAVHRFVVDVRQITLAELIDWTGEVAATYFDDAAIPVPKKRSLRNFQDQVELGLWGERYDRRGNTLLAVDRLLIAMVASQPRGLDFGLELWAMGRQLQRETASHRAEILALDGGPDAQNDSVQRGTRFMDAVDDAYDDPDFEADARGEQRPFVVSELWADAFDAYYWFAHAVDACNQYDGFPLDAGIFDPTARVTAARPINDQLIEALTALAADMQGYLDAGGADDRGPARAEIIEALDVVNEIRFFQRQDIGPVCAQGDECISDADALQMELLAIELARKMQIVASKGAFARLWQNCLVLMIKFRIEISIIRVETSCGRNNPVPRAARASQSVGLEILADDGNLAALNYYLHPDRQCLLIRTYNDCLVPAYPDTNDVVAFPAICEDDQEEQ